MPGSRCVAAFQSDLRSFSYSCRGRTHRPAGGPARKPKTTSGMEAARRFRKGLLDLDRRERQRRLRSNQGPRRACDGASPRVGPFQRECVTAQRSRIPNLPESFLFLPGPSRKAFQERITQEKARTLRGPNGSDSRDRESTGSGGSRLTASSCSSAPAALSSAPSCGRAGCHRNVTGRFAHTRTRRNRAPETSPAPYARAS